VLYGIPDHYAFLAPYELGYDPNLKPYPYDPRKAKELLAQAGYAKGFDLKLYWMVTGRYPMAREVAETVASYLEAVGIRTKLIGDEWVAALARQRAAQAPDAEYVCYFAGGRSGLVDPSYMLDLYFGKDGGFSVYYNPELEKITGEARATINEAKRAELIKKGVRIIDEDVASIPIFNTVIVYALKKNIDFKPTRKYNLDLMLVKDVTMR
jgi:peptide/nickel transport system substrate-binding protein